MFGGLKLNEHSLKFFKNIFHPKFNFIKITVNFCFKKFVRKESFLLFLKQRLFLPCPKTIQLFYRAARIKCKKLEVSTMSRYWDFLLINLLACLLTESVFCDFLSNAATNLKSVFCKRCEIPGTNFSSLNILSYLAPYPHKIQKTDFSIWTKPIDSHVKTVWI